jgi:hypothetical protein
MEQSAEEIEMVHYACEQCSMTATLVWTLDAKRAWLDHMQEHHDTTGYRMWSWGVRPLFAWDQAPPPQRERVVGATPRRL